MLTALNQNDELVFAFNSQKLDGGKYRCRDCDTQAILKKGTKKVDHFAHKPGSNCTFGGESFEHESIKLAIFKDYSKTCEAYLEHKIGDRRCDVAVKVNGEWVAIEVQLSAISFEEIIDRTINHNKHGYHVIWVNKVWDDIKTIDRQSRYLVKKFVRQIHDIQNNQLFQYCGDGSFNAVHLMGITLKTYKYLKILNKKYRLTDLEPIAISAEDVFDDYIDDVSVLSVKQSDRWWERLDGYKPIGSGLRYS